MEVTMRAVTIFVDFISEQPPLRSFLRGGGGGQRIVHSNRGSRKEADKNANNTPRSHCCRHYWHKWADNLQSQGATQRRAEILQVSLHHWTEAVRLLHRLQGPRRQEVVLHQDVQPQTVHAHACGKSRVLGLLHRGLSAGFHSSKK